MRVLGINAVFHDPGGRTLVDGRIVAAAEEERFSWRKHGKRPVPRIDAGAVVRVPGLPTADAPREPAFGRRW